MQISKREASKRVRGMNGPSVRIFEMRPEADQSSDHSAGEKRHYSIYSCAEVIDSILPRQLKMTGIKAPQQFSTAFAAEVVRVPGWMMDPRGSPANDAQHRRLGPLGRSSDIILNPEF